MRGHHFAYRLNQRLAEWRAFFIQAAKWFPLNTPPPTRQALAHRSRSCKVRLAKNAVSARRVIKSRVNAVPRDAKRNLVNKLFLCVLTFNMQIKRNYPTMLPPRSFFCLSNRFFANFNHAVLLSVFSMLAVAMLISCPSTYQAQNRPRNGQVSKPTKNRRMFSVGFFVGA